MGKIVGSSLDPQVHLVLSGVGDRVAGKHHLVFIFYLVRKVFSQIMDKAENHLIQVSKSSHLRVSQEHGSQGISKCVILFFEDIRPIDVEERDQGRSV